MPQSKTAAVLEHGGEEKSIATEGHTTLSEYIMNRPDDQSHPAAQAQSELLHSPAEAQHKLVRDMKEQFCREPGSPAVRTISAKEIMSQTWPEPNWIVRSLLPPGLTIVAGKAKVGKSWMMLQLGKAVAEGGQFLGEQVAQGPVLYLALEDPPQRLSRRMRQQCWPDHVSVDFLPVGQFGSEIGDLRNGGQHTLSALIEQRNYRLVIIDTLSRSCPGDQDDVRDMTTVLDPLQATAHRLDCAIVLVDHHGKAVTRDSSPVTDVIGSTAKGAIADSIWGLYREPGKIGAKLSIVGRDIEERTLAVTFRPATAEWDRSADEAQLTPGQEKIMRALEDMGEVHLKTIATACGIDEGNLYKMLSGLVNQGKVVKDGKGKSHVKYRLA